MCITVPLFAADNLKEMSNAINTGDAAKVKTLLDSGFDPNSTMPNGQPAVMAASNAGNAEIVEQLIKAGADVSLRADTILGGNALTGAVWSTGDTSNPANTIKIIQLLLDAGIDINSGAVRDESGDFEAAGKQNEAYVNPLWYAAGSSICSADVVDFMLKKGCTPSRAYAINGASGERKDFDFDDLLDAVKKSKANKADRKEYNRIVKILKDVKDKSKPAQAVAKAAPAAAPVAAPAAAPVVKQEKASPAATPKPKEQKPVAKKPAAKKQEPAVEAPKAVIASFILSVPEATEMLRKAAENKNMENFYRALSMGADVNSVDNDNKTPLLLAVMSQSYEMTEVLIHKGAKVNIKSKGGNTPLSMAKDLGADDIVQLLQKAGAKN